MKRCSSSRLRHLGFARKDLVALLGLGFVAFIAIQFYLMWSAAKEMARSINCCSNLKQIGVAFRVWEGDNDEKFPMQALTNNQGFPLFAHASDSFIYFQVMSNELADPKYLACPSDKSKTVAQDFGVKLGIGNISYFVGLEADDSHPQSFLTGDNHLINGQPLVDGRLSITTNQLVNWGKRHHKSGNISQADGSVDVSYEEKIADSIARTGLATNILLMNR